MVRKIFDGLYAFIWQDNRENNCNTFLIDDGKRVLIDPGHMHLFRHVEQGLASLQIEAGSIDLVIVTHAHPDHMEAARFFKGPTQLAMGRTDYEYLRKYAGSSFDIPEPDLFLKPGDLLVGPLKFEVMETPGHTPGSICLYWPKNEALFTGDLVFDQGIGRTDLPGGSPQSLKESILKVETLSTQYLLPGHGEIIAGKEAVRDNFTMIREYWFKYL
jgi:hydroxyacylglutathione hydrolase